jgi:outer membrane murein-binding lipoprotein Lpp
MVNTKNMRVLDRPETKKRIRESTGSSEAVSVTSEEIAPKKPELVLAGSLESIRVRVERYKQIKADYIDGEKVLSGTRRNEIKYEDRKKELVETGEKLKSKIQQLENAQDSLNDKVKALEDASKAKEESGELDQNDPILKKLQRFKSGRSGLLDKMVGIDNERDSNSNKLRSLPSELNLDNNKVIVEAEKKIETSLAKLKVKSDRLTVEYLESSEGKLNTAIELVANSVDKPDVSNIMELVGNENYPRAVEGEIDAKVAKELLRLGSNSSYESDKNYSLYIKHLTQLAQSKGVNTNSRDFRGREFNDYDDFIEDSKLAEGMVAEELKNTPGVLNKIKKDLEVN